MAYEMEIKDEARAALRALPDDIRRQIGYRLHLLQQDFTGNLKKLKGSKNEYRLRVGSHRAL
jgi:mRNA-degrading endonuclease RelE of RelBE toxin-antitoxin system